MEDPNKSIEEINKSVSTLSQTRGVNLQQLTPLTSEALTDETPIKLPPTPSTTIAGGVSGRSEAIIEQEALEEKAREKRQADEAKLHESQKTSQSLLERIGIIKKTVTEEEGGDIPLLRQEATTARNKLREAQVMELGEIKALENQPGTLEQKAQRESDIRRKYGFTQLEAQLSYYMATENLASVQETLNDRLTLELEPLYQQLDLQKGVSEQIYDQLSTSEKREWDLAIGKTEQSIAERKELSNYRSGIITTAMQNGVSLPSYVVQELNRAKTQEEINQVLARNGVSLAKPEPGSVKITPEDNRTLIGAGFTPAESKDIVRAVNDFGVDAVLETLTDERQKAAVRKVFNVQQTVTRDQIDTQVDLSLRQGKIDVVSIVQNNLTEDEIKEKAKAAGFSTFFLGRVREDEITEFLESPEGQKLAKQLYADLLEEQYRAANIFE